MPSMEKKYLTPSMMIKIFSKIGRIGFFTTYERGNKMELLRLFLRYSYKNNCGFKRTLLVKRTKDILKRDYCVNVSSVIIEEPRFEF